MGTMEFLTNEELGELLTAEEFWYEEDPNVLAEFDHYEELRKTVMGE